MLLTAFLNTFNFRDRQFVFFRPSPGKLFSTHLRFSVDLSLRILGTQASNVAMRLAIPTHLATDIEFTCMYLYWIVVSVWEHQYWSTKVNSYTGMPYLRNTTCSFITKFHCPKHSKYTYPTKDYFKAIWNFPLMCIRMPQTTIQCLFLTQRARSIRLLPPEIPRTQKQTWETLSQRSFLIWK